MHVLALALAPALARLPGLLLVAPASPARNESDSVVHRDLREPTFSVAAIARFDVQLASAQEVIQPYGFGFAAQVRAHALPIGRARLGAVFVGGYSRWSERRRFAIAGDAGERTYRSSVLYHVDLGLGPSLEIPAGPVFVIVDGTFGVAISGFRRPLSDRAEDDQTIDGADPLLRGGLALGIPIRRGQGLVVGAELHKIFSDRWIVADPLLGTVDAEPDLAVFDLHLAAFLGYQLWF